MIESNHVVLWNRCLDVIKDNVPETTYNTWFAPIVPLKYEDKTLILQIPSQFFYEILEERFVDLIRKTLYKVIGEGTNGCYSQKHNRRKQSSQLPTGPCRSGFGSAFESQL